MWQIMYSDWAIHISFVLTLLLLQLADERVAYNHVHIGRKKRGRCTPKEE